MCGLAGLVGEDSQARRRDLKAAIEQRGPDGQGETRAGEATLFHTRLAIQDLSSSSSQPFRLGSRWLAWNGEIYNQAELRDRLIAGDRKFNTTGDTEVLAHALDEWDTDALSRLRGMFALAWWDEESGRLLLARDRFGMKPLYYRVQETGLEFCSLAHPLLAAKISREVFGRCLLWGGVGPTDGLGLQEVEPGGWVERTPTCIVRGSFVSAEAQRSGTLGDAFHNSVQAHLVSDVPVGHFLSGGVDSTAIAIAAARLGHRLHCLTLDRGAGDWEPKTARLTAARFGHDLEIMDPHEEVEQSFEAFIKTVDLPSIDGFNVFLLASEASRAGLKVALAGTGGDEVLGGYRSFRRMFPLWALSTLRPKIAGSILQLVGLDRLQRERLAPFLRDRSVLSYHAAMRSVFTGSEINTVAQQHHEVSPQGPPLRWSELARGEASRRLAAAEISRYLRFTLLRDGDNFGMAHGLELRFPFVDQCFAPVALRSLGAYPREGKPGFVKAIGDPWLSEVSRRPKRGFDLPIDGWLRGPLSPYLDSIQLLVKEGVLVEHPTQELIKGWRQGAVPAIKVWALLNFALWIERRGLEFA